MRRLSAQEVTEVMGGDLEFIENVGLGILAGALLGGSVVCLFLPGVDPFRHQNAALLVVGITGWSAFWGGCLGAVITAR